MYSVHCSHIIQNKMQLYLMYTKITQNSHLLSKIFVLSDKLTIHLYHSRFQYVLAAPTSIATKNNEETLTYLNQGQSYEIKLKKLGDLSSLRGKILKVCYTSIIDFHIFNDIIYCFRA